MTACTPDRPSIATDAPAPQIPDPTTPADTGTSASLLHQYAGRGWTDERLEHTGPFTFRVDLSPEGTVIRDDTPTRRKPALRMRKFHNAEPMHWELPFHSKRMVAALLSTAADNDLEHLRLLFTPDAQFGLPDTRMLQTRPLFAGDGGAAFLRLLRAALSRIPAQTRWGNSVLVPGVQVRVHMGTIPHWSYYDAGMDRIFFRAVIRDGRALFDYVGFFRESPTSALHVEGKGPALPLIPALRRQR